MKKLLLLGIGLFTSLPLFTTAQTLYFGSSGTWTSSVWGTSSGGPFTGAWVSGRPVEFNAANSTVTYATTIVSGITANGNVTVTSAGTFGTGGTIIPISVASGATFDFGTQNISVAAGTGFIKNGTGVLAIQTTSNLYPGGITINEGTLICKRENALGGGALIINGGIIAGTGNRDFSTKQTSITFGGDFTLGATTGLALATANLIFDAPVSLGTSNRNITVNGTGTNTFSGTISGGVGGGIELRSGSTGTLVLSGANTYPGGITVSGGTLILSGANTYAGSTALYGGTLTLGAANVIPDGSVGPIFNGGTLKTGAFSETYPPLFLFNNSNIILNASVQSHNFAASNSAVWASDKTLTVTGWTGGYNSTTGTAGKIFVGTDASGLTPTQLTQIKFFNGTINYDATILSTGEVVPSTISVLPISLTTFTAKPIDKNILLNWATASEKENQKFEVFKSADGKTFESVTTVNGAGNSDDEKSYAYVDENPFAGTNYYQLKQTDFNGVTSASNIISANAKIEDIKLSAYASTGAVTVNVNSPNQTDGELGLFDMNGRKLASKNLTLTKGFNEIVFNQSLNPGTYFINLISAGKSLSLKFIK